MRRRVLLSPHVFRSTIQKIQTWEINAWDMLGCFAYAFTEIVEFWAGHTHSWLKCSLTELRMSNFLWFWCLLTLDCSTAITGYACRTICRSSCLAAWKLSGFSSRRLRFQDTLCHIYDISWHMYIIKYVIICVYIDIRINMQWLLSTLYSY